MNAKTGNAGKLKVTVTCDVFVTVSPRDEDTGQYIMKPVPIDAGVKQRVAQAIEEAIYQRQKLGVETEHDEDIGIHGVRVQCQEC